jgi:hypothetical protein
MARCRHKRLVMATAECVHFYPDQEPFTSGVIECAGVSDIEVSMILVHYCPNCKIIVSIEALNDGKCKTTVCNTANRCNGHE